MNVNSVRWCYRNIANDEWEIDYWKSEVILFVVESCLNFRLFRIQGEGKGKRLNIFRLQI